MSIESKSAHCSSSDSEEALESMMRSLQSINEDTVFHTHGYQKINKICDTLQGELYKSITLDKQKYVCIKKTPKYLCNEQIAYENGTYFCVSKNICKEASVLKYLTVDNQCIGDYIVKYVNFFHSETDYYLVMEYIESETNLKQFISQAQKHIINGKLSMKEYSKMMKYLLWQLFVTIYWCHELMNCCHLDICMENIMLQHASFIESDTKDEIHINPKISIKLTDWGVAECFYSDQTTNDIRNKTNIFRCEKQGLSIFNEGYFAPNVFNGYIYNAQLADNWSLGMIMFQCLTVGKQLYSALNMYKESSGYLALFHNKLAHYLSANNMLHYFNVNSFKILNSLLNVHEEKRLKGIDILKNDWFKLYFKRYKKQIVQKIHLQKQRLIDQQHMLKTFPFYC
eukprot:359101_1